jgi:hypothetical protein
MTLPNVVELLGFETAVAPKDITGVAQVGDWMSLKDYSHATIVIIQGAWAGGTPAVTLQQATDVSGADAKALAFDARWSKVGLGTGSQFTKLAVVSNTFNLGAVPNTVTLIEIDGDDLDVDGGFDCLSVSVASPGTNADLLCVFYVLSGARYQGTLMPDAKVD